ncbi:Tctex1 domain-containing protein 1 [Elysia marginata]|uniref:Tctex1 domain-containing protein 1 n=1 Tax=Elysia marginata TaxID=1093978 RepID=A0AAV4GDC4_9GAST|nr:Tctex1 domain-containing protein 1 [Elysia marginata]
MYPVIEYENTYKLEPDAVFLPGKVKAIIKEVLEENLKGQTYKANLMASRCMALSDIIKERIRQLEMPRFKTVVLVLVGENKAQALSVASQCLWNKDTDNFASCEYSKGNLHVVAMAFGVYQE